MIEILYAVVSFSILELFAIVILLCLIFEERGQRKVHNEAYADLTQRALDAESDLTQAQINIALQNSEIEDLEEMKKSQLENAIALEEENKKLRIQRDELKSLISPKSI